MTDPRLIAVPSNPGQVEPGPFSEHDLREQWNAQADEFNQWESLDSSEQLAWAQACVISSVRLGGLELGELPPPAPKPADPWGHGFDVKRLADRLDELADYVTQGPDCVRRNFTMRVPAEPYHDADLVIGTAARLLRDGLVAPPSASAEPWTEEAVGELLGWSEIDGKRIRAIITVLEPCPVDEWRPIARKALERLTTPPVAQPPYHHHR